MGSVSPPMTRSHPVAMFATMQPDRAGLPARDTEPLRRQATARLTGSMDRAAFLTSGEKLQEMRWPDMFVPNPNKYGGRGRAASEQEGSQRMPDGAESRSKGDASIAGWFGGAKQGEKATKVVEEAEPTVAATVIKAAVVREASGKRSAKIGRIEPGTLVRIHETAILHDFTKRGNACVHDSGLPMAQARLVAPSLPLLRDRALTLKPAFSSSPGRSLLFPRQVTHPTSPPSIRVAVRVDEGWITFVKCDGRPNLRILAKPPEATQPGHAHSWGGLKVAHKDAEEAAQARPSEAQLRLEAELRGGGPLSPDGEGGSAGETAAVVRRNRRAMTERPTGNLDAPDSERRGYQSPARSIKSSIKHFDANEGCVTSRRRFRPRTR